MDALFTKKNVGCYCDGAGGHWHLRYRLSDLMAEIERLDLQRELRLEASDDESEIFDAIEALQERTEDGLVWILDTAGDLILTT